GDRRALISKLLAVPYVQGVMLLPKDAELPADKEQRIRVHLDLTPTTLPLDRQRFFADQVRAVLTEMGFQEASVYDHRGHRRFVGSIPLVSLNLLLNDLREDPAAEMWLRDGPDGKKILMYPFGRNSPVAVIEVFPGMELPPARPEPEKVPAEL